MVLWAYLGNHLLEQASGSGEYKFDAAGRPNLKIIILLAPVGGTHNRDLIRLALPDFEFDRMQQIRSQPKQV